MAMKFCPECGKKLIQPIPKYCPNCGKPTEKATAQKQVKPSAPVLPIKQRVIRLGIAIILIILLLFIGFYLPGAYWQRAVATGGQYYNQMAIFKNDVNDLNTLIKNYNALPLQNSTLSKKLVLANAFAAKARESLTSWNYFESFLSQNEAILQSCNVNASNERAAMALEQRLIERNAELIAAGLQYLDADPDVASTLNALKPLKPVYLI